MGVSVDRCKGGWEAVVAFAEEKDCQNKEAIARERSKRKGARELQSLACSITYENSKSRHGTSQSSGRDNRRSKGAANVVL